jgi:hypothetical protein
MITIRKADERGHTDAGWLDSHHSFSFGHYFDPKAMGFGPLRVINDDRVAGGGGFPPHPHADMEIVSYVLEGALQHRDSLGTGSVIRPGDVQRMSAGTGLRHSEFNASATDPVHFLQIWILPEADGFAPSYEQTTFGDTELADRLRLVAARDGREGALTLHRDVDLYAGRLTDGTEVAHTFASGRLGGLQVARGSVTVNGQELGEGDGAAIERQADLTVTARGDAEVLLFDMGR